jgi:hypothetical protein
MGYCEEDIGSEEDFPCRIEDGLAIRFRKLDHPFGPQRCDSFFFMTSNTRSFWKEECPHFFGKPIAILFVSRALEPPGEFVQSVLEGWVPLTRRVDFFTNAFKTFPVELDNRSPWAGSGQP